MGNGVVLRVVVVVPMITDICKKNRRELHFMCYSYTGVHVLTLTYSTHDMKLHIHALVHMNECIVMCMCVYYTRV